MHGKLFRCNDLKDKSLAINIAQPLIMLNATFNISGFWLNTNPCYWSKKSKDWKQCITILHFTPISFMHTQLLTFEVHYLLANKQVVSHLFSLLPYLQRHWDENESESYWELKYNHKKYLFCWLLNARMSTSARATRSLIYLAHIGNSKP